MTTQELQNIIKSSNISWYKLANDLGLNLTTVYRWKQGNTTKINSLFAQKVKTYLKEKDLL